jgi:putative transposase
VPAKSVDQDAEIGKGTSGGTARLQVRSFFDQAKSGTGALRSHCRMSDASSGWHSRGYLPHFDAPEVVQTVVFRLADSLPRHVENTRVKTGEIALKLDGELDKGVGACWMRRPEIAALIEATLLHFDGERYFLLAWCAMPNHIHAMLEMRAGFGLGDQVRSWKTFSARRANRILARGGAF